MDNLFEQHIEQLLHQLKKQTHSQVSKQIKQLADEALHSKRLADKLLNEFKIMTPRLLKNETAVVMGEEKFTGYVIPSGASYFGPSKKGKNAVENQRKVSYKKNIFDMPSEGFSPGQTLHFVLITVPIDGSYALFVQLLKNHSWSQNFNHTQLVQSPSKMGAQVFFKAISAIEIIGNTSLNEKIKSLANAKFREIVTLLHAFRSAAKEFNFSLRKVISAEIGMEKNKRKAKTKTERKLNPFA